VTVHVDPRAVVHPTAKLADGVNIGPFVIIGEEVTIGTETSIAAHAAIERWTIIGARCRIGTGAVLGGAPQHLKYDGSPSYLHIGDENDIRELVVIQRSMKPGGSTRLGSHNFIMAQAHIAHDCVLGNHTTLSSLTGLAGHVEVEDGAVIGASPACISLSALGPIVWSEGAHGSCKMSLPFCWQREIQQLCMV